MTSSSFVHLAASDKPASATGSFSSAPSDPPSALVLSLSSADSSIESVGLRELAISLHMVRQRSHHFVDTKPSYTSTIFSVACFAQTPQNENLCAICKEPCQGNGNSHRECVEMLLKGNMEVNKLLHEAQINNERLLLAQNDPPPIPSDDEVKNIIANPAWLRCASLFAKRSFLRRTRRSSSPSGQN